MRSRKKLTAGLTGILVLALVAVAAAVQTQTAQITFSSQKAGSGTNIRSVFKVSDPANTMPPGKPTKHTSRVDIMFPKDMTFNDKAYPKCPTSASSPTLLKRGACNSTILGRGATIADGRGATDNGFGIVSAKLTAFNAQGRGLFILVDTGNSATTIVLNPKLTKSNVLETNIPKLLGQAHIELTDFNLFINPKAGRLKGKKTHYAVLPKKCPKGGKFIIKTKYYFQDPNSLAPDGTYTTPGTINKCHK